MNGSALITGGASGLGLATARSLLERGLDVVVADLPGSDLSALSETSAVFVPTDVRQPEEVRAAVEEARRRGPLRLTVACAGIPNTHRILGSAGPMPTDEFQRVIDVNLVGTATTLIESAAIMQNNELWGEDRGVVVMTSSIAAFDGYGSIAYSASKAGVAGMTLSAAHNLAAHAIRVVAIAPGMFATPMLAGVPAALSQQEVNIPHPPRPGRGEEFAALVGHILDNPLLNGEVIRLDSAYRFAAPIGSSKKN
jgi:NAD(P)-dependent dehydrogenase (short-subunit alcohol dehydrogenase family)